MDILLQQIMYFFMNEKVVVANNLVKWLIFLLFMGLSVASISGTN
jgi:hypothetical protein